MLLVPCNCRLNLPVHLFVSVKYHLLFHADIKNTCSSLLDNLNMSLASGIKRGSDTMYSNCNKPSIPVPRKSVAGSFPTQNIHDMTVEVMFLSY